MVSLQSDDHGQFLLFSDLVGFDQLAITGGVNTAGLFHEDVLSSPDGRLIHQRSESGRGGQEHHVDVDVDRLLIGVEAGERRSGGTSIFCL